jgi:hypothetical protein
MNWLEYEELINIDLFEERATESIYWKEEAMSLREGAEVIYDALVKANKQLREDMEKGVPLEGRNFPIAGLNSIWMMSIGYAVENIIKALVIKNTPKVSLLTNKGKLDIKYFGKSHDLIDMIEKSPQCTLFPEFSIEEKQFLSKMTYYILWQGKYPIPLEPKKMSSFNKISSEPAKCIDHGKAKLRNDEDKDLFESIFNKIVQNI